MGVFRTDGRCFDCIMAFQETELEKLEEDEDWVKVEEVIEPQSAYDIELDDELLLRSFSGVVTETSSGLSTLNNLGFVKSGFVI